jgi:hypothetical protein
MVTPDLPSLDHLTKRKKGRRIKSRENGHTRIIGKGILFKEALIVIDESGWI